MITKDQATTLGYRAILHHSTHKNADGTPMRVRVNGKCQTWVTRPTEFKLPVKHGLRDCGYVTHITATDWSVA